MCFFLNVCVYGYCMTFAFDTYFRSKIDRWIILKLLILIAILYYFLFDFVMFCLRLVGGLDYYLGFFNLFFECLKWIITRIKEPKKNDPQTINFAHHEKPVSLFIGYLISIFFWTICLIWVPFFIFCVHLKCSWNLNRCV